MIVGLNRELEWRRGVIVPRERKVIEFPVEVALAVNDNASTQRPRQMAPVINIRLEPRPEMRTRKWMGVAAVLGAVALTIITDVARQSQSHPRWDLYRGYRSFLQLSPDDDYSSAVRKLGMPAGSQTAEVDGRVVRSLNYPERRYSVVLLGSSSTNARYIGTVNMQGRILDSVRAGDGSTYELFLHSLSLEHSDLRTVPTL
jgi:hypothetical protein